MEGFIFLLVLVVIFVFLFPSVALVKAHRAERGTNELKKRLQELETQLRGVRPSAEQPSSVRVKRTIVPEVSPASRPIVPPSLPTEKVISAPSSKKYAEAAALPISRREKIPPMPPLAAIDWEQFMGAKLFAWIGGLALFLGVAFFVQYSFEHNLIPPELRVAIGFLAGTALVTGGLTLKRKENVVTAQTLCATGILILYTVTFACPPSITFPSLD